MEQAIKDKKDASARLKEILRIQKLARAGKGCSFFFLKAEKLVELADTELSTPESFQKIFKEHPDWFKRKTLEWHHVLKDGYFKEILVVSHRWEHRSRPDSLGHQINTIRSHLAQRTKVKYLFYE